MTSLAEKFQHAFDCNHWHDSTFWIVSEPRGKLLRVDCNQCFSIIGYFDDTHAEAMRILGAQKRGER